MERRFCSLDQTHLECESTFVEIMSSKSSEYTLKKKVFIAIWDYIRPEFVGFIRADRPLFRLIIQRSNLGGGTRLTYNLKYW